MIIKLYKNRIHSLEYLNKSENITGAEQIIILFN